MASQKVPPLCRDFTIWPFLRSCFWWSFGASPFVMNAGFPRFFLRLLGQICGVIALLSPSLLAVPLHLDFLPMVDGKPLSLDSLRYQNKSEETYSVTRLDWLATEISLTTTDGASVPLPGGTAFVPTRGTTLSVSNVPEGSYTALTFYLGPDSATNHSDPASHGPHNPLNPNLNNLHWDWQGGYIFLAIEGHWRAPTEKLPGGYAYHYANDHNRLLITLPIELTLRNESRIAIALDVEKAVTELSFQKDGATTHSQKDDPIAERLHKNLSSAFRILTIVEGGVPQPAVRPAPIDLPAQPEGFPFTIPSHIPIPPLPADNPLLISRVALGKALFHEPLLSRKNSLSCASCHQGKTLSDPRILSSGTEGQLGTRHSMPLFNLAWKSSFFWDGRSSSLREQALLPIQDHLEMDESLDRVVAKLKDDPRYPLLFAKAFGSGAISPESLGLAIEAFLLTQLSLDSKLDQSRRGRATLNDEEKRGFELFFTESEPRLGKRGADCFHCHGGALFSDHSFHNNGLPPTEDLGLEGTTGRATDRYKFSTPSLRNIALTAPYMHDGRFATLEEVVAHYNAPATRTETLDPNLAKHPNGLGLSEADQAALVAFLKALTDPAMLPTREN